MSEDPESKTEEPTAQKLSKAREKGDVSKTPDLASFATLAAASAVIVFAGGWLSQNLANALVPFLSRPHAMALDGAATVGGGYHPGVASPPGDEQLIFGVHVAKQPLAFHLTLHRYFDDDAYAAATGGELDWLNLSFERRF